jgi:hypothetical protein
MTHKSRAVFAGWLILFLLVLLFQGTTFLSASYFLAECIRNGNRWIAFGSIAGANLVFFVLIHLLNNKMSVGELGSSMQALRTSRFTAAFINVTVTCLASALVSFLVDELFYRNAGALPFAPLGILFVLAAGFFEFIFTYYLFQGQGISRL